MALAWYQLAADQGDAQAQFNLGVMIAKGRGTAASQTVAKQWLQLAADQGDAQALYNLGVLHQGTPATSPITLRRWPATGRLRRPMMMPR